MSIPKFLLTTGLMIVGTTIVKLVFINILDINRFLVVCTFWLIIALIAIASCRRFGVINYLESFVIIVAWLVVTLLTDVIFLTPFTGFGIYYHLYLWVSYLVVSVAVFVFHKKRHIEIRRSKKYISS